MQMSRLFNTKPACCTQQCTYVVSARASPMQAVVSVSVRARASVYERVYIYICLRTRGRA